MTARRDIDDFAFPTLLIDIVLSVKCIVSEIAIILLADTASLSRFTTSMSQRENSSGRGFEEGIVVNIVNEGIEEGIVVNTVKDVV